MRSTELHSFRHINLSHSQMRSTELHSFRHIPSSRKVSHTSSFRGGGRGYSILFSGSLLLCWVLFIIGAFHYLVNQYGIDWSIIWQVAHVASFDEGQPISSVLSYHAEAATYKPQAHCWSIDRFCCIPLVYRGGLLYTSCLSIHDS